jgi:hypothetical protein
MERAHAIHRKSLREGLPILFVSLITDKKQTMSPIQYARL